MELRFMGIHAWVKSGKRGATFIRHHLPADSQEAFREWCRVRVPGATFQCSEGARAYDVVCRGGSLELTMRQIGALSMDEVKQLQISWTPGADLLIGFMAIEAVGRPDVDRAVRANVANSFAWDKDLEQM